MNTATNKITINGNIPEFVYSTIGQIERNALAILALDGGTKDFHRLATQMDVVHGHTAVDTKSAVLKLCRAGWLRWG